MMLNDDTLRVLRAAKKIVENKYSWTQGAIARDACGGNVSLGDERACRWCAVGAVAHAANMVGVRMKEPIDELDASCIDLWGHTTLVGVNDHLGQQAAVDVFSHAIARLEAE